MISFIFILVAILIYEFFVFALSRRGVAVTETKLENSVVFVHWGLRLSFGLTIALLTLLSALWGGIMYDQSDPYTSNLALSIISVPGLVLAVIAMLLCRIALSGRTRSITLVSLFIVGICFILGGIMAPYMASRVA